MRLIDADRLNPDRMTNKGTVAISQSQIAKAPTVDAVPMSVIEDIKAELISLWGNEPCSNECGCLDEVLEIIDKHTKENSDADSN